MKECTSCGETKSEELFPKKRNVCKKCKCATQLRYAARHPDRIKTRNTSHYERNAENLKADARAYRENNPETIKRWRKETSATRVAQALAWKAANPVRVMEIERKRSKSPKRVAMGSRRRMQTRQISWGQEGIEDAYAEARYFGMHVDHIVPLNHPLVCGLHVWDNLQLLSPLENFSKGNRFTV